MTAFYQMGILGEPAGGVDIQSVFAAALSAPIDDEWSVFGELALDSINARNRNAVFTTGGVAWAAYDHTVFDGGVRIGLNDDATDFGLFVGCTHNLGELFRR